MKQQNFFKIVQKADWNKAVLFGEFSGSADDRRDGYIHLSTAAQVRATAARHFAGADDLMLLEVDPARIDGDLKWEPARGGELFPHLYAPLPAASVTRTWPLPVDDDGVHVFPEAVR